MDGRTRRATVLHALHGGMHVLKRTRGRSGSKVALVALVLLGTTLAACGDDDDTAAPETGGSGEDAGFQDVIDAAEDEGAVTWYTALPAGREDIAAAFTEKYGVEVEILNQPGGPLIERFQGEAEAGAIGADIMTIGHEPAFTEKALGEGWIEPVEDAELPVLTEGTYPADRFPVGTTATVQVQLWIIGYNTDLLDEADYPSTWEDLADPKYAGEIASPSPSAADAYVQEWSLLRSEFGDDLLSDFADNDPVYYEGGGPPVQALGAGEHALVAPVSPARIDELKASGAPVDYVIPDLVSGIELGIVLTASDEAQHPNAARLFADFLLSEEAAEAVRLSGLSVYGDDVPEDYVAVPLDTTAEQRDEIISLLGA